MSNFLYYLWNFKPGEKNSFLDLNKKVIDNNKKFFRYSTVIRPLLIEHLIENEKGPLNSCIFPKLKELYYKIPKWIIKTDLARLLIIYHSGGAYCDSDCEIKKNFNYLLQNNNLILFTEKIIKDPNVLGERECKSNKIRIANYFFYSKIKEHPFLKEVIDECLKRIQILLRYVIKSTKE